VAEGLLKQARLRGTHGVGGSGLVVHLVRRKITGSRPGAEAEGIPAQYLCRWFVLPGMDGVPQVPGIMTDDRKSQVAQIFHDVGARLRRFVRRRVRSDADADDVVADVWERFLTALEGRPLEQAAGWLFTVARNRIIDRSRRVQPVSLEALAEPPSGREGERGGDAWLPVDLRTPATEHLRPQFWRELHAALAELPPEQRQVFIWHEFDQLSFQEIAELTGENLNTLLSRKRYAVLHLRTRLRSLRDEFLEPR
jgi:RNA polymerase sigma factor (sigma-70 family)